MKKRSSPLRLTWLGHSAFHLLTPGGKSVLIDPWVHNPRAPKETPMLRTVDLILITHGHNDHIGDTLEIVRSTGATVVAIYEVATFLTRKGITTAVGINKGGTFTLEGLRVTLVDAKHSSTIEDGGALVPLGEAAGIVLRLEDGRSLYHAGDTAVFGDMALLRTLYKPDIALLPIGDLYTMGPREAALACSLLKPKTIIGMHYGTFPALSGTPAALKKELSPEFRKRVMELVPGETREL